MDRRGGVWGCVGHWLGQRLIRGESQIETDRDLTAGQAGARGDGGGGPKSYSRLDSRGHPS